MPIVAASIPEESGSRLIGRRTCLDTTYAACSTSTPPTTNSLAMKYPLEALGPDRFQELCQALLAKSFPKTQCFPLNQGDGGRDAVLPLAGDDGFLVFQVKHWTGRTSGKPARSWLLKTLRKESQKLKHLIPDGASQFVLLTNAYASGTLNTGSLDQAAQLLRANVPIPATCWWRDDIERRLDNAWDIKWSFPEVFSSPDFLRLIFEQNDRRRAARRTLAVRASLRDQFEKEKDVRFKQVDLQNDLLTLFVDVPLDLREPPGPRHAWHAQLESVHQLALTESGADEALGAASLLLNPNCQAKVPRIVLEGAPGQGKSTIAQYVCQIHRHRILQEEIDHELIPSLHRQQPVRLPFKIDCRDLNTWLSGELPFPATTETSMAAGQRTLETFLCTQTSHHSGGAAFSVDDLHALLELSPVLLAFDGLDEVADIERRRLVVENIVRGVARLEEISLSVQTLVTSRPAAFANSPSFPQDRYLYLSLTSIGRATIERYTERWVRARQLESKHAADVRTILATRLDEPHLAELARNPMQLAILLSLIHTRGVSLPDKRTTLYDRYVDLFFAREAEKNDVVRVNRDLLVDLHGHLAWLLHSEAQSRGAQASVSDTRLRLLVRRYLEDEGHDPDLASAIFTGITERVVALVSRVEGTFEFEVQPLREYFAARHLYNTTPYAPPGEARTGTLPERFAALSKDFFWLNVTRFYAGCYSAGQLPSLIQSLNELNEDAGFAHTRYPQELAAALLSDWTFAQYPRLMRSVIPLVVGGSRLRHPSSQYSRAVGGASSILPRQCGGETLVCRCLRFLSDGVSPDFAEVLLERVRQHSFPEFVLDQWRARLRTFEGEKLTRWLSYGRSLRLLGGLSAPDVQRLLDCDPPTYRKRLLLLEEGGVLGPELDGKQFEQVTREILENPDANSVPPSGKDDAFGRFRRALAPGSFVFLLHFGARDFLPDPWTAGTSRFARPGATRRSTRLPETALAARARRYVAVVDAAGARFNLAQWRGSIEPWSSVVEAGRRELGNAWVFRVLAFLASATKTGPRVAAEAAHLFDEDVDLCLRAKYARLRAGSSAWWSRQLSDAPDFETKAFALLLFCSWAGPKTLSNLGGLANELADSLPDEWWSRLHHALDQRIPRWSQFASKASGISLTDLSGDPGLRFLVLVASRLGRRDQRAMYERFLERYDGTDPAVLNLCLETSLRCAIERVTPWPEWLESISRFYMKGGTLGSYLHIGHIAGASASFSLDLTSSKTIIGDPDKYPLALVALAERVCRWDVSRRVVPVGEVAKRDRWFQPASS